MPSLRLIPVPHPLSGATDDDVRRYAVQAVAEIRRLLSL
jgi:hypothetical protein